ncbi:MAG: hypothetical protein SF066_07110 [Thermoanaerobaculia bacterium]|nr:hypothetical protein [Thermoanaerobaculia bacterium]
MASLALEVLAADLAELRARIEKDFQLLPVQSGLVLTPREPFRGIRSIEIDGDQIAVNGQTVSRREAEDWLGERAAAVLALGDLDRADQQRLAGRNTPSAEAEAPVAPDLPPAPEPPSAEANPTVEEEPRSATGSQGAPAKGSVHVRSGETVEQVFVVGGSATIDGKVERDATVFGGHLRVNGSVRKDVVAVGGNVYLGPESFVGGDVTSVAGQVIREDGSEVEGRIQGLKGWSRDDDRDDRGKDDGEHRGWAPVRGLVGFGVSLASLVAFALVILLVVAAAPRSVERVGTRIAEDPVRSGLVGLLVLVFFFPLLIMVSVLLAVTIIGIPILVFLWLTVIFLGGPGLVVAILLGYASVAVRVGRFLERRFSWQLGPSAYAAALVGVLGLSGLSLVGDFASALGGILFLGLLFTVLGALVLISAVLVGFGGVCQVFLAGRTVLRWKVPGGRPEGPPPVPSPEA